MLDLIIMACKGVVIASALGLAMAAVGMWLELKEEEDGY